MQALHSEQSDEGSCQPVGSTVVERTTESKFAFDTRGPRGVTVTVALNRLTRLTMLDSKLPGD